MLTLFLIIASVFAEGETEKLYIQREGHLIYEYELGQCYKETIGEGASAQTTYFTYKKVETETHKCTYSDDTCGTGEACAKDETIEEVDKFEYIAKVIAAEGENCATPNENEVRYYYHGDCVVVGTTSEQYTIENEKLVLKQYEDDKCETEKQPATTKRAESTEIACDACLEGNLKVKCVPQESSSEPETKPEESSSEPETKPEESSSEPEEEKSQGQEEEEKSQGQEEEEKSQGQEGGEEEEGDKSSEPEKQKYYIIPYGLEYEVFEMDTCYASEKDVYMQYKAENIKKIKLCGYTDKDCKDEVNCEAIPLEGGKWVDDLTDYVAVHKSGDVANDKDCTYLSEGNYKMLPDKCFVYEGLYMKYDISDNKIRIKIYTDEGCNTLFEPQEEAEGIECDKCYSSEEGSEKYECGAFQTFIAVALAFVFFLF